MNGPAAPVASFLVYEGFLVLPIGVALLLWLFHRRARVRMRGGPSALSFGVAMFLWLWATGGLGLSGILGRSDLRPPPVAILAFLTLLLASYVGLSRVGAALATLPLSWLVALNAFRFPLELLMHQAAVEGVMPKQMSYAGWNFDILTGVSAILLAPAIAVGRVPRWVLGLWNALGALLLLNIVLVAGASTPLFRAFGKAPGKLNTFVAFFPYVWLPTVLVATAMVLHIVIARALRARPQDAS